MNCCDYDALTTYPSGEFGVKHKTNIFDKIIESEKCTEFNSDILNSFYNCEYRTYKTIEKITLYRIFGSFKTDIDESKEQPRGAKINGIYASTEFAESIIDAKIRLALHLDWKNTKMYEAKIKVPENQEISVGIVAPVELKSGTVLPGGAEQIILPKNWPLDWIIGIRRVTGRQLQKVPEYPYSLEEALIKQITCKSKESLYTRACPVCGCESVKVLSSEEQFSFVGCEGNTYTMKYYCENSKCNYYW